MKPKMKLKMGIDLIMTVLLLCQMSYMLIGETTHEWMGMAMFCLFVGHNLLNLRWYKNLFKGRYTRMRILQTTVNFLVFAAMIGLMVSGIIMSRAVFSFLDIGGSMSFARILHMLAAYWGFILMSIHLGLHWSMVMGMMKKISGTGNRSAISAWIPRAAALLICILGIYAFIKNDIASYLFLRSQFVFFDTEQPLILFFAEYLAMMGLWVCIAYYGAKLLQVKNKGTMN